MIIQIWYCPRCDHETYNWRICQACKDPAVYKKFVCVPVEEEVESVTPHNVAILPVDMNNLASR